MFRARLKLSQLSIDDIINNCVITWSLLDELKFKHKLSNLRASFALLVVLLNSSLA